MPDPFPPRALPAVLACRPDGAGVALDLDLTPAAGWFAGHFPGWPILPGVVQLDWALTLAQAHLDLGGGAAGAVQVKFKRPLRPGDRLTLRLSHDPARHRLDFEYCRDGQSCASGRITVTP